MILGYGHIRLEYYQYKPNTITTESVLDAQKYSGVAVKFVVKNRTVNWLTKIGVRNAANLAINTHPAMSTVFKGRMATNAFFKAEGLLINIGLGFGKALDILMNCQTKCNSK